MSTRKGKRCTTSYREKQDPKQNPYAMVKAPKGPAMCRTCRAIYANTRWYVNNDKARKLAEASITQKLLCPACQKIKDDYPEGLGTLKWSDLREHVDEIRGLIANVEERAVSVNPLDRVMKVVRRKKDLEVQTTNRLGRALVRAYKGKAEYKWAHRDMNLGEGLYFRTRRPLQRGARAPDTTDFLFHCVTRNCQKTCRKIDKIRSGR